MLGTIIGYLTRDASARIAEQDEEIASLRDQGHAAQRECERLESERQRLDGEVAALKDENRRLAAAMEAANAELSRVSALRTPITPDHGPADDMAPMAIPPEFTDYYRTVMLETFYKDNSMIDIHNTEVFERDLAAHVEHRFRAFEHWIGTWLAQIAPNMSGMTAIEIGSGTGCSTLAFARRVRKLISFEIDEKASAAAKARLSYFGYSNVDFHNGKFDRQSAVFQAGSAVDMVILCAVLEHMTYDERIDALGAAWELLAPGGLLVVADTPNRFNVLEDHTSQLHFYSALPTQIQRDYVVHSPRADFVNSIKATTSSAMEEVLARWGFGVSYHDFELAIGKNCHDYVVMDGYETAILSQYPDRMDDALLRLAFDHYKIPAHRAFTRHNLHFVMRKPIS